LNGNYNRRYIGKDRCALNEPHSFHFSILTNNLKHNQAITQEATEELPEELRAV